MSNSSYIDQENIISNKFFANEFQLIKYETQFKEGDNTIIDYIEQIEAPFELCN